MLFVVEYEMRENNEEIVWENYKKKKGKIYNRRKSVTQSDWKSNDLWFDPIQFCIKTYPTKACTMQPQRHLIVLILFNVGLSSTQHLTGEKSDTTSLLDNVAYVETCV